MREQSARSRSPGSPGPACPGRSERTPRPSRTSGRGCHSGRKLTGNGRLSASDLQAPVTVTSGATDSGCPVQSHQPATGGSSGYWPDSRERSMHDDSIAGRSVLVFGAGGALGAGVAAAFAGAGAVVTGADKVAPPASRRLDGVKYEAVDVLDDEAVGSLVDAVGLPWAVLNTIGGYAPAQPLAMLDPAELTGQFELNVVTAALITKHALR